MARVLYAMVNSQPTRRVASIGNSQLGVKVRVVKSAKFTRDSVYLASDEFLIISWGGQILLYM